MRGLYIKKYLECAVDINFKQFSLLLTIEIVLRVLWYDSGNPLNMERNHVSMRSSLS